MDFSGLFPAGPVERAYSLQGTKIIKARTAEGGGSTQTKNSKLSTAIMKRWRKFFEERSSVAFQE